MLDISTLSTKDIQNLLQYLTPAEQAELDELLYGEGTPLWVPLQGPQMDAYECMADITGYGGAAGGGKGILPDEKVVTPFGYRLVKDLKVGERVLAFDGTMSEVIGVYPQPRQPVYRVRFADGGELVTDGPHRWNYSIARKGKWRKSGREWKVGTTEQLREQIAGGRRVLIPLCEPLKFNKAYRFDMRPLNAYALGLLLGDGYTAQTGPGAKWSFSTNDPELLAALPGEWVPDGGCDYRLRGPERPALLAAFERLGLAGCKADTKCIPESYKWSEVSDRFALLQGLMDTDGTASEDGKAYFTSTSKQLAEDVRWLVLSLGGRATITSRTPVCTNGATGAVEGAEAHTCYIRMPDNATLFRLSRKRARAGLYNGGGTTLKRRIVAIEPAGEAETICIAIDHPSSLYVAGDHLVVTHNTDLAVGLSTTKHLRTAIFRREKAQTEGIVQRMAEILGHTNGLNSQKGIWRIDGRIIEFAGLDNPNDHQRWQGRAHDLKVYDEVTEQRESQVRFTMGWRRSPDPNIRPRVLMTFNPPTTAEGQWVIAFFGPWLDRRHPNPAKPGELRWFTTVDGKDEEVPDGRPFVMVNDEKVYDFDPKDYTPEEVIVPLSRTFIPARLTDNPYYMATGYMSTLQALPEPLRSQMLNGDFSAGMEDDPWQIIPTAWVDAAMDRWEPRKKKGTMSSMGVDIARGGKDNTVISPRYDMWFDELLRYPGTETPDGPTAAGLVIAARRNKAPVHVDLIGWGSSAYDALVQTGVQTIGINNAHKSLATDKSGALGFANRRAETWWKLREALDPANDTGIELPPDDKLRADLCAPIWFLRGGKIQVEEKEEVKKRIGRSPDDGDAVVMANIATLPWALDPTKGAGANQRRGYNPVKRRR